MQAADNDPPAGGLRTSISSSLLRNSDTRTFLPVETLVSDTPSLPDTRRCASSGRRLSSESRTSCSRSKDGCSGPRRWRRACWAISNRSAQHWSARRHTNSGYTTPVRLHRWPAEREEGSPTQRDSRGERRGGQRSSRSPVYSTGSVNEAREALEDARGRADVIDSHEATSCERDDPLLLQVQHLQHWRLYTCTHGPKVGEERERSAIGWARHVTRATPTEGSFFCQLRARFRPH